MGTYKVNGTIGDKIKIPRVSLVNINLTRRAGVVKSCFLPASF